MFILDVLFVLALYVVFVKLLHTPSPSPSGCAEGGGCFMNFDAILTAFINVLTPLNLIGLIFGVAVGIIIGALPGLSVNMGIALLFPLTFSFQGIGGILMLLGVYCGAIYGGSISAILLKTPGTPASAATTIDGYPMAVKYGQPGRALACPPSPPPSEGSSPPSA